MRLLISLFLFSLLIKPINSAEPGFYSCENHLSEPPWASTRTICVSHAAREPSGSGRAVLVQSFVPGCDSIEAVELGIGGRAGWGVLELVESADSGEPGRTIARAFLYRRSDCPLGAYGPTTFYFGKTPVKSARKHFLRYLQHSGITAFTFTDGDMYGNGELLGQSSGWDLTFTALSAASATPYLRQITVSKKCSDLLNAFKVEAMPDEGSLLEACDTFEPSVFPKTPPNGSAEWILSRLFSAPYEVKEEGFSAFRGLTPEDKTKVVSAVFAHLDDEDAAVKSDARNVLKSMGGEAKSILPQLLKKIEKGVKDLDLLASLGPAAREAVPYLLGILKRDGKLEVAETLQKVGVPEVVDPLVDFYLSHMRDEIKKLELEPIDLRNPENLPRGCIMKEFLSTKLVKALGNLRGDGVTFGSLDFVFSDDGTRGFSIEAAANLLERNVVGEAGYALILSDCRLDLDIAGDIRKRLGRDARPAIFRDGCQPRGDYPEPIAALVQPKDKYSGIELHWGTSREACGLSKDCTIFSKAEFERLLDIRIPYFMDQAMFSIGSCQLEKDHRALNLEAKKQALKISKYRSDGSFRLFLTDLPGEWCGSADTRPGYGEMELRLTFTGQDGVITGNGTAAYPKYGKERPRGIQVHSIEFELIPKYLSGASDGQEAIFSAIGTHQNLAEWRARKTKKGFIFSGPNYLDRSFSMTRACEGFWNERDLGTH